MVAWRYGISLLVLNSISHSFAMLTREISRWTLEEKFHISARPCIIVYFFVILQSSRMHFFIADCDGKLQGREIPSNNKCCWISLVYILGLHNFSDSKYSTTSGVFRGPARDAVFVELDNFIYISNAELHSLWNISLCENPWWCRSSTNSR